MTGIQQRDIAWPRYPVIICISLLFTLHSMGVCSGDEENITSISIATPAWKNQTHQDGSGLFFDIVRAVYAPLGMTLEYRIVPWKRAVHLVESREVDAMLCVLQDSQFLIPQYPLFIDYTAVLFKKQRIPEWKGLETLDGKTAAWPRGYNYHTQPQMQDITVEFYEVNHLYQGVAMLSNDRVDFYIDALIDLAPYIREHDIDMRAYQLEIPYGKNAYIGFARTKRSEKLIHLYDARIPELSRSGELEALFNKWRVRFEPVYPTLSEEDEAQH